MNSSTPPNPSISTLSKYISYAYEKKDKFLHYRQNPTGKDATIGGKHVTTSCMEYSRSHFRSDGTNLGNSHSNNWHSSNTSIKNRAYNVDPLHNFYIHERETSNKRTRDNFIFNSNNNFDPNKFKPHPKTDWQQSTSQQLSIANIVIKFLACHCQIDAVYKVMVSCIKKAKTVSQLNGLEQELSNAHIAPDLITFNALITALGKLGTRDDITAIQKAVAKAHIAPDLITFSALITARDD
ncbi:hypothetical protein ACTFIZ_012869 [Dictyostelium cf. discoideum]